TVTAIRLKEPSSVVRARITRPTIPGHMRPLRRWAAVPSLFAAGVLAAVTLSASGATRSSPDLAGEWHLDEIVTENDAPVTHDSSGNGLTGRVNGVEIAAGGGRFGNAFLFD